MEIENKNLNKFLILKKLKKVSCEIIHKIQNSITKFKSLDKALLAIKGDDSIINVFLKISSLLCKLIAMEDKIKEKNPPTKTDDENYKLSEGEIQLMKDFLSNYNINKERAKDED